MKYLTRALRPITLALAISALSPLAAQGKHKFFDEPPANGGANHYCRVLDNGQNQFCVTDIKTFKRADVLIARLRVDVSRVGSAPHNEYMIWNDCGAPQYRILSREPQSLPAIDRWTTVEAVSSQEIHKILRAIGAWACNQSVVAGI